MKVHTKKRANHSLVDLNKQYQHQQQLDAQAIANTAARRDLAGTMTATPCAGNDGSAINADTVEDDDVCAISADDEDEEHMHLIVDSRVALDGVSVVATAAAAPVVHAAGVGVVAGAGDGVGGATAPVPPPTLDSVLAASDDDDAAHTIQNWIVGKIEVASLPTEHDKVGGFVSCFFVLVLLCALLLLFCLQFWLLLKT